MTEGPAPSFRPTARGFEIVANGRAVRLPDGTTLLPASARLAEAISEEWRTNRATVTSPTDWRPFVLTRLQATLQRLRDGGREPAITHLVEAADAEPLCYRDRDPAMASAAEDLHRSGLLAWAGALLGEQVATRPGIMPFAQSPALHAALHTHLASLGDAALTGAIAFRSIAGSLVLALALVHRRLDAEAAAIVALAEEEPGWNRARDPVSHRDSTRALARELAHVTRFLDLVASPADPVTQT